MMAPTDDRDLDHVIDTVARDLTAGDPPAHLRARVMARLDERPARRWRWWTAAACAAGVMAAVVMTLPHRHTSAVSQQLPTIASTSLTHEPRPSISTGELQPLAAGPRPKKKWRTQPPAVPAASSAEELAWQSRTIPALDSPDRVTLADIQPAPLEIRPLVTNPLTVPALADEN
jgi:hypothetical protein